MKAKPDLSQLSHLDQAAFTHRLAGIFEHSPWVPERTWAYRPFTTLDGLHQRMVDVVRQASTSEQLALIRAHPELAGQQAHAGTLTSSSTREQRGAGLDQCSPAERQRLQALNARYREKFGFPFVIAVKGRDRHQIMDAIESRLNHSPEAEFQACLDEIARIARFRLEALINKAPRALDVETLEPAPFAPFGHVMQASTAARRFMINDGNTERFHDLAPLQAGPDGRIIVSLFRAQPRVLPFTISMMERHPLASQAFIPLSGQPWLTVVAPAGRPPDASDLRLFLCRGDQGVNYAPGVWHHPLLALETVCDFIVLDRDGPGENCDVTTLAEPAIIQPWPSQ